jgi:hypothetical protein
MPDIGVSKDALRAVVGLTGEFVGTTDSATITTKTINTTDNTLTATSQAAGDILVNNATKFVRLAKGSANQPLKVNSGGTDLDYGTLPVAGGGTGAATLTAGVVVASGTSAFTTKANPTGAFIDDSSTQNISGLKTFTDQRLKLRNPANTFTTTIRNPAITADGTFIFGKNQYSILFIDALDTVAKVIDGSNGILISTAGSTTDATIPLQYILTSDLASGGKSFLRQGTYPFTTGLTLALTSSKFIDIEGAGNASNLDWGGTGYALTISGTTSIQDLKLQHFRLSSTALTASRHGILDQSIAPWNYYERLKLRNLDIALNITNSNARVIKD